MFSLFVGGKSYATKADNDLIDVLVPENMRDYFRKTRIEVPDLRTVLQEKVGQVEKFSVMYPKVELRDEAWRAVLAACPDVEATTSLGSNIELNAPGVTKGSGLLALAEKLGLRRDQVMAVGDSGNDLSMIEDAGLASYLVVGGKADACTVFPEVEIAFIVNQVDGFFFLLHQQPPFSNSRLNLLRPSASQDSSTVAL